MSIRYEIIDRNNIRRIEIDEVTRNLSCEELEREILEFQQDINTHNDEIRDVQAKIAERQEMLQLLNAERAKGQ